MPSSPISDPLSPPNAGVEDATDNNFQPFFVLHKALPQNPSKKALGSGKARRKIDMSPLSPKSVDKSDAAVPSEATDAICERFRLEAFDLAWSKIDTTIKEALRQINLSLFDEVYGWVRESFTAIRSSGAHNVSEIECPYPLVTDTICKQIPTALILTRNAEIADDLLTFQELGGHLRSNRCHVANLSAVDFSTKHGLGGCLRGLLRELITHAPDVADITIVASWYCEPANYDNPIVLIIDDMERCNSVVLAEFITMLSEWVRKLPIIFIMGVTTTVDALRRILPSDSLQHLQACKFTSGSPSERVNAIIKAVLARTCSGFNICHEDALFLRNYFLRHDGTVTSFIRALKLSCIRYFTTGPLSSLGQGILDEDCEAFSQVKCEALPDNLRYASDLPSYQSKGYAKEIFYKGTGGNLAQVLSGLRWKDWSSVVMALSGDPRRTIQVDLLKSHTHLQCSCCGGDEDVLSPSMHDTSIMYSLAQEYGDLINLHDWYQSFKSRIINISTKTKRKVQHSPASKKAKTTSPEDEATIQARFCRAVIELQITGLLRMPSKRRPDFVQRVAFGL